MPDHPQILALCQAITALRRPRLLIRAARCGQVDYNRSRDLKRLLHSDTVPDMETALRGLLAIESEMETTRVEARAEYSFVKHIEILIALIGELRAVSAQRPEHEAPVAAPMPYALAAE